MNALTTTAAAPQCQCGCGARTGFAQRSDPSGGYRKGDPVRFLPGHANRTRDRVASQQESVLLTLAQKGLPVAVPLTAVVVLVTWLGMRKAGR